MKKISVLLSLVLLLALVSCNFNKEVKILDLSFDFADAIAVGTAESNGVSKDLDDEEEPQLELKKITTSGSETVLHFENASNTENFVVVDILKDPYGASDDFYLILDACVTIYGEGTRDNQELYFGPIVAVHPDGSYTDVVSYQGRNGGYLVLVGDVPIKDQLVFDHSGNLYFAYDVHPAENVGTTDLFQYNPKTRKTTNLTNYENNYGQFKILLSKDEKWLFARVVNLQDLNAERVDMRLEAFPLENPSAAITLYDRLYTQGEEVDLNFSYDDEHKTLFFCVYDSAETGIGGASASYFYKAKMVDGTFRQEQVEKIMENSFCFNMFACSTGLWDCQSFLGVYRILDEKGEVVNEPVYHLITEDWELGLSREFSKLDDTIILSSAEELFFFDTRTGTSVDMLSNVVDRENLHLNSYSLGTDVIFYNAEEMTTGECISGVIDRNTLKAGTLPATENFASVVIINELAAVEFVDQE